MDPNPTLTQPLEWTGEVAPETAGMSPHGVQAVVAVFDGMLARGLHPGAQLVVLRHGRVVIDRAGGATRLGLNRRAVTPDTPFLTFSVTKPFTAMAVHSLVERGLVDLDAPVCEYWPEFGCKGKETATVRHALLHQAGIPVRGLVQQILDWPSWSRITRRVAALPAEFPPGTQTAYHMVNFGWILGEVVRRVSGQPIERYLRELLFDPLAMRNSSLGLPRGWQSRAAGVYTGHREQNGAAFVFSLAPCRRAVLPAATLHSTARDLATFYQMLNNRGLYAGRRLLQPETIEAATALRYEGLDGTIGRRVRWAMGFHLGGAPDDPAPPLGRASTVRTYGHGGQGTCIAWADPDAGLVLAFTCNRLLESDGANGRWNALADAVWAALTW